MVFFPYSGEARKGKKTLQLDILKDKTRIKVKSSWYFIVIYENKKLKQKMFSQIKKTLTDYSLKGFVYILEQT